MSPVWIIKAGLVGTALIFAIASRSVPRIWVSGLVEADMTVVDLEEGESRSFSGKGIAEEAVAEKAQGFRHAAKQSPQHAGAGPDHVFECPPPATSCLFRLVSRGFSLKGSVFAHCGLLAGAWFLVRR